MRTVLGTARLVSTGKRGTLTFNQEPDEAIYLSHGGGFLVEVFDLDPGWYAVYDGDKRVSETMRSPMAVIRAWLLSDCGILADVNLA